MRLPAQVDVEEALKLLKLRGKQIDDDLNARFVAAVELCEFELTPRGVYHILPVERFIDSADERAVVLRGITLSGNAISKLLANCTEVALLAVTLGTTSQMLIRRQFALSPLDGMFVDACASSMADMAAQNLNEIIDQEAKNRGFTTTHRFSPGYGDLPLSIQPEFLKACGAERELGIRVSENYLLIPEKSITAVIGMKKE